MNTRRKFIKNSLIAGLAAGAGLTTKAFSAACGLTPPQTPGPFYPGAGSFKNENDLTRVGSLAAKGQVIFVQGYVKDEACRPIEGANVEIWQACASGKYNNPNDPNPAPLDPGFKYWGETYTDAKGEYGFKSILPGQYPAGDGWIRPPHIHFKISRLGFHDLVTQMYFAGNPLNEQDLILRNVPPAERSLVVVAFRASPFTQYPGLLGRFDITLKSVG